jgi:thiamine biosynthesis lipoprotein ApbE
MKKQLFRLSFLSLFLFASCSGSSSSAARNLFFLSDATVRKCEGGYRIDVSAPEISAGYGTIHLCDASGRSLSSPSIVPLFGTSIDLSYFVRTDSVLGTNEEADAIRNKDFEEEFRDNFRYTHALFDRHYYYKDDTNGEMIHNLKSLNDSYGKGTDVVYDARLYDALKKSLDFSLASNGKFDIGVGALSLLWDYWITESIDYSGDDSVREKYYDVSQNQKRVIFEDPKEEYVAYAANMTPSAEELKEALVFNDETHSIRFDAIPRIDEYAEEHKATGVELGKITGSINHGETFLRPSLTFGGFGKGEATELFRRKYPEADYFINSGASSIVCNGEKPDSSAWEFTLASPLYAEESRAGIYENDYSSADYVLKHAGSFSFSTSGYYNQYFYTLDENGNRKDRRTHIVDADPSSSVYGYSHQYFASTSVLVQDSGYGDMYTTALYNCDSLDETKTLLSSLKELTGEDPVCFFQVVDAENSAITLYADASIAGDFSLCTEEYPKQFTKPSVTTLKSF